MKQKITLLVLMICLLTLFVAATPTDNAGNENEITNNLSYVESIKAYGFLADPDSEVIMTVNGWNVTQADLDNRIAEHKSGGIYSSVEKIMDILFEEACRYAQAEEIGVLATDSEVEAYYKEVLEYLKEEPSYYKENPFALDALKYYGFKFITFNNAYQYYLQEGRALDLITPSWTYDEATLAEYAYGNGDDYYFEKILDFKKNASWTNQEAFSPTLDQYVLLPSQLRDENISYVDLADDDIAIENGSKASWNPTINALGNSTWSGSCYDWGIIVRISYSVGYHAEKTTSGTKKQISKQDLIVTAPDVGNLDPALSRRVSISSLKNVKIYTSTGTLKKTFLSWTSGYHGSYFTNVFFWGRSATGGDVGLLTESLYAKATAGLYIDNAVGNGEQTHTVTSNSF